MVQINNNDGLLSKLCKIFGGEEDSAVHSQQNNSKQNSVWSFMETKGPNGEKDLFATEYVGDQLVRSYYDKNGDGKPDSIQHYEYSNDGKTIKTLHDKNADGNIDRIETNTYDENVVVSEYDIDADGNADCVLTREYDEKGRMVRSFYDNNADGNIDRAATYIYNGENTEPEHIVIDHNNDGIADKFI